MTARATTPSTLAMTARANNTSHTSNSSNTSNFSNSNNTSNASTNCLSKEAKMKLYRDMFSINRGMVLIKSVVFVNSLGARIILPYLTLQMRSMGMTFNDVALVYGAIPFLIFMSSSVSGKSDYAVAAAVARAAAAVQ